MIFEPSRAWAVDKLNISGATSSMTTRSQKKFELTWHTRVLHPSGAEGLDSKTREASLLTSRAKVTKISKARVARKANII